MPILELKAGQSAVRRLLRAVTNALFRCARISARKPPPERERPAGAGNAKDESRLIQATRQRLAEAAAHLERLDAEREHRDDSRFGETTEHRIVWRELIELELQEIDQQVSRISGATGPSPGAPLKSHLREGGSHERNES